ncbi:heme exporter protein CcmD [Methylopila sp. 73B]|uniref:heme exporter protein CcmD n=1 Tax=Methylopila sp. 73B TaxID=1120792 RepID=UPI00037103B9|nr:heme exporter protein CcmD [Methylopila sp. 73B]
MTDAHFGYIAASYAIAFAVIAGLILWTALDQRAQRRALAELEARSGRQRPASGPRS